MGRFGNREGASPIWSFRRSLFFLWVGVIVGVLNVVWQAVGWGPFVLARWRNFGASPIDAVLLSLSFYTAVWASYSGWHTKDRLRHAAKAAAALSVLTFVDFAFFLSMPLAWIVSDIHSVTGSASPTSA